MEKGKGHWKGQGYGGRKGKHLHTHTNKTWNYRGNMNKELRVGLLTSSSPYNTLTQIRLHWSCSVGWAEDVKKDRKGWNLQTTKQPRKVTEQPQELEPHTAITVQTTRTTTTTVNHNQSICNEHINHITQPPGNPNQGRFLHPMPRVYLIEPSLGDTTRGWHPNQSQHTNPNSRKAWLGFRISTLNHRQRLSSLSHQKARGLIKA